MLRNSVSDYINVWMLHNIVKSMTPSCTLTIYFCAHYPSIQGHPPQHHRFNDTRIPAHITYAYKKNVTIIKNDDFYQLPGDKTYTIDLLFLMSNAPVSTASFPEAGSQSYVGLANSMELAMDELSTIFPEMLLGETKSSNRYEGLHALTLTQLLPVIYMFECNDYDY